MHGYLSLRVRRYARSKGADSIIESLALKVLLTPALIGGATLVGRRWGPALSGWLIGIPFTSAPIVLFLALEHGRNFATTASIGVLAGGLSQTAFCLGYAGAARRFTWPLAFALGTLGFAAITGVLQLLPALPPLPLFAIVIAALAVAIRILAPGKHLVDSPPAPHPSWDLPVRMLLATASVLLLTGLAPVLGPRLTGLLTPFPVFAAILAIFAQHLQGHVAAIHVLSGLLSGLFSFATFFFVLAGLLEPLGVVWAFAIAFAAMVIVQGSSLWVLQRSRVEPASS